MFILRPRRLWFVEILQERQLNCVKAVRLIRIYQIPGMILFFTFSLYSL